MEEVPSAPARFKETSNLEVTLLDSKKHPKFSINSTKTEMDQLVTVNSHLKLSQRAQPEEDENETTNKTLYIFSMLSPKKTQH
jgi:hypothetical protein